MNRSQKIAAILPIWLMMIVSYNIMLHVIFDGGSLLRLTLAVLGFIFIASLALLVPGQYIKTRRKTTYNTMTID